MLELNGFLELCPRNRTIGEFEKSELEKFKGKIPEEIIEFLHQEQKAVFGKDFFWSVSPSDYHSILDSWGLDGQNSFVFLRSSFGCLAYFYKDDFYALNPHKGTTTILVGNIPNLLFNLALAYVGNLEHEFCFDLNEKIYGKLPTLQDNQMYTLVPALAMGGNYEKSNIEVVEMYTQLDILAQLCDNKTKD